MKWVVVGGTAQGVGTRCDPDAADLLPAAEDHTQEREAPMVDGPLRHEVPVKQIPVVVEVLELRAVRQIEISEDGPEALDGGRWAPARSRCPG